MIIAATLKYIEDGKGFIIRLSDQDPQSGTGTIEDIEVKNLKEAIKVIEKGFTSNE